MSDTTSPRRVGRLSARAVPSNEKPKERVAVSAKSLKKPTKQKVAAFPKAQEPVAAQARPEPKPQMSAAAQQLQAMAEDEVKREAAEAVRLAEEEAARKAAAADGGDDEDAEPELLTRRSRINGVGADNWADIPESYKKPGWDYEYKTTRYEGKDVDPSEMAFVFEQGWRPVRPQDMPGLCPPGYKGATIERYGQILCMRPMRLTLQARAEDYEIAEQQKNDKIASASAVPVAKPGKMNPFVEKLEIYHEAGKHVERGAA